MDRRALQPDPAPDAAPAEPPTEQLYSRARWPVRDDIEQAHRQWLDHVAGPGAWWTGEQRTAFVAALWAALDDPAPPPPWDAPAPPAHWPLPASAHGLAYRLARHGKTTTRAWYEQQRRDLGVEPPAFVELVALAATGCAVATFGPALGLPRPALLAARSGEPSGEVPVLVGAKMNWVPVAPPADEVPAVVQAFSAAPAENAQLWRFAAAQYMALEDMVQLDWQRPGSPLQRRQLELVAARLSMVRECFY